MNKYMVTVDYFDTFTYEIEAENEYEATEEAKGLAEDNYSGPDISAKLISKGYPQPETKTEIIEPLDGQIDILNHLEISTCDLPQD